MQTNASKNQPQPIGQGKAIIDYVIEDFNERAVMGKEKYGTLLRVNNGRDALWDAYQEAIDLCMYLRQAILEKEE